MAAPVLFTLLAAERFERPVTLRLPFRFGAATVTHAVQAFVRVRIALADGRSAQGATAEMMMPRWFDKSPAKTTAQNVDDLRWTVDTALAAYTADRQPRSAFGHSAAHMAALAPAGREAGLTPLASAYGGALLDKALLDALCRALALPVDAVLRDNLVGLTAQLAPDLAGFDIDAFLSTLTLPDQIQVRHTVGMLDSLLDAHASALHDGLPVTLAQVIAQHGVRHFKLKLAGDTDADLARLLAIAAVLDRHPGYVVTLDGNEQFADAAAVHGFLEALRHTPALQALSAAALYLEQPLPRDASLTADVHGAAALLPLLIDESDGSLDAFAQAVRQGYTGVSSKSCKGLYKSLTNAMRCAQHNAGTATGPRLFISAEDLTAPAGLAVQQDLALAGLLGVPHVERNGHHYVHGFAGQQAPAAEALAFHGAHPGLYDNGDAGVVLRIRQGALDLRALRGPGFASTVHPDFDHWSA